MPTKKKKTKKLAVKKTAVKTLSQAGGGASLPGVAQDVSMASKAIGKGIGWTKAALGSLGSVASATAVWGSVTAQTQLNKG